MIDSDLTMIYKRNMNLYNLYKRLKKKILINQKIIVSEVKQFH